MRLRSLRIRGCCGKSREALDAFVLASALDLSISSSGQMRDRGIVYLHVWGMGADGSTEALCVRTDGVRGVM